MAVEPDSNLSPPPCRDRPSIEAMMGVFSIALGCVGLLSTLSFMLWDLRLTRWAAVALKPIHPVMDALTQLGEGWVWLVPSGIAAAYFFLVRKSREVGAVWLTAFAAVALTGILTNLLKIAIGRYRPKMLFRKDLFGFDPVSVGYEYNSMPSGHSTTCGAVLVILWLYFPKWRWVTAPAAVFVASTRIWVTAHYLSDVFTGLLVGATGTFVIYYIAVGAGWVGSPEGWRKSLASRVSSPESPN